MTRMLLLTLLSVLGLAGCAQTSLQTKDLEPSARGFDIKLFPAPNPVAPLVYVENGYLVVNQEPIRLYRIHYPNNRVTLQWQLPAGTNYSWPLSGAVTFKPSPKPAPTCLTRDKLLACSFGFESKAVYKYTLTALDNGTPLPPLDPVIINME